MSDGGRPAELFQLDRSTCIALLGVHHVGRLIIPGDDPYVIRITADRVSRRLLRGAVAPASHGDEAYL
ncbi:MAG: hypothetical protein H0U21_12905 [Acidimicrobiia bacterium]|nr:hypothetical protein [Acidimicrobiia bacterium]